MAPNSEEDSQIPFSNRRSWGMDFIDKEPLRPPVYNPEDYATSLKKWGKKGCFGIITPQYLSQSTGSLEKLSEEFSLRKKRQSSPSTKSSSSIKSGEEKQSKKEKELTLKIEKKDLKNKENISRGLKSDLQKDFLNPILNLSAQSGEMSLRQFSSVTELLTKLKVDLKLSFPSFVQEFVGDPIDGVTLLLELLRCVQLTQSSQQQRCPPQILRRALLDEHSCLVCLKHCLRCPDASRRLASSSAGLFTLAVSIMSNVTQSRTIALELLTKACEPQAGGHRAVSEALSTLRLRFGEPVRFRFLVGMLSSAGAVELLTTAMKFINAFVSSAPNLQQKVYIQAELEQAGFSCDMLRKTLPSNSESVKVELNKWEKNYFDVEKLHGKIAEVNVLQEKVHFLEKRVKILQEEKGILQSLEQCLKERCSELEEIQANESTKNLASKSFRNCDVKKIKKATDKGESTPAEDEGISSSEQELSQDEDYVKKGISYTSPSDLEKIMQLKKIKRGKPPGIETNRYSSKTPKIKITSTCNLKNLRNISKMKETNVDDGTEIIPLHGEDEDEDERETTIDEVIEELENIVNDAETEACASEEKTKNLRSTPTFTARESTFHTRRSFSSQERINFEESEIIPAVLHPQPPKRAKSLVHIYFPGSELDSHNCNKNEFFEESDSENSDSLLTATRDEKSSRKGCRRSLEISESFNSYSSANTRTLFIKQEQDFEEGDLTLKSSYEERNIDEEEIRRKLLKTSNAQFPEVIFKSKILQKINQKVQNEGTRVDKVNGFENNSGISASSQAPIKRLADKVLNESPFSRTPKLAPTPVKRSQTFHLTSAEGDNFQRVNEMKPKPKMGVRGLDFQRSSEQKMKNENWLYQVLEYKKNSDLRVDSNERYLKRAEKEFPKSQNTEAEVFPSSDRESFRSSFTAVKTNRGINMAEHSTLKTSLIGTDKITPAVRTKGIEKMDKGLDSLVDIVISSEKTKKSKLKNEWNAEVTKNIGPRTRRSLAESSIFCSQHAKTFNEPDQSPKPPKPAQRTSLTRNNSSTSPTHLPVEIQLAPLQPKQQHQSSYNFDLKPAKSVDSLLSTSQKMRYPPDGSSSPLTLNKNPENQQFSEEKAVLYSTPFKPNKVQTFFGNPKFNSNAGNEQNLFERAYPGSGSGNSANSQPQNVQNASQEKLKSETTNSMAPTAASAGNKKLGVKDYKVESKPIFLLGTYQTQPSRILGSKQKINSSVLQSINSFNANSFVEKNSEAGSTFSRVKKNIPDVNNSKEVKNNPASGKVTDCPSGLY